MAKCHYTLKRSQWGFSLFHDGQLVASGNDPFQLMTLPGMLDGIHAAMETARSN